jgi:hypothetical protein
LICSSSRITEIIVAWHIEKREVQFKASHRLSKVFVRGGILISGVTQHDCEINLIPDCFNKILLNGKIPPGITQNQKCVNISRFLLLQFVYDRFPVAEAIWRLMIYQVYLIEHIGDVSEAKREQRGHERA